MQSSLSRLSIVTPPTPSAEPTPRGVAELCREALSVGAGTMPYRARILLEMVLIELAKEDRKNAGRKTHSVCQ